MKREGGGEGFAVTKKPHMEKSLKETDVAGGKYGKNNMDTEKELAESVDKLSAYVKKHRMKY